MNNFRLTNPIIFSLARFINDYSAVVNYSKLMDIYDKAIPKTGIRA